MAAPERAVEQRTTLLDPAFVRELEALRRRLQIRARSGASGEHLARRRGGASEFHEHRPYSVGDDLRRIDWAAYARSGEPVLKVFRAEEDVVARLLVDHSASLDFGTPSKLEVARRLAAAIGYMTLASSERAQLFVVGEGLEREHSPSRGRAGLPTLLRQLDSVAATGKTELGRALDAMLRRCPRPGLLVLLSDFLDSGALLGALHRAAASGHDVALLHLVAPEEIEPAFDDDVTLEDAETGATVDVTMDSGALEAYVLRFAGLCEELRSWARKHGASYVRVRTDSPLDEAVRRFVARSID
jgi:uncharacterized protein (DUF58 family)